MCSVRQAYPSSTPSRQRLVPCEDVPGLGSSMNSQIPSPSRSRSRRQRSQVWKTDGVSGFRPRDRHKCTPKRLGPSRGLGSGRLSSARNCPVGPTPNRNAVTARESSVSFQVILAGSHARYLRALSIPDQRRPGSRRRSRRAGARRCRRRLRIAKRLAGEQVLVEPLQRLAERQELHLLAVLLMA